MMRRAGTKAARSPERIPKSTVCAGADENRLTAMFTLAIGSGRGTDLRACLDHGATMSCRGTAIGP
jgi:hypothetical protein